MVTPFVLDKVNHSTFGFSQINSHRIAAGIDTETGYAVGHVDPMFRGTKLQRTLFEFTTPQLMTVLSPIYANCGVRGNSSDLLTGAIASYLKEKTSTGTTDRGIPNHQRLLINKWHMHWSKITLPHRGMAEASMLVNAVYDTVNDPLIFTPNVDLPGNLTALEQFGCGGVTINGTVIGDLIEQIDIASGVKLMQLSGQDAVWDIFCGTEQTDTIVTIKLQEAINWGVIGLVGAPLTGNGLEFYARRKGSNGPLANGTAAHIYFQGPVGRVIPVDTSGQGSSVITDTIQVELNAPDDSTLALTATVDSIIS